MVKSPRGISLMSTLLLVTIVVSVAAAMAGVFTLNINLTNRVSNGSVALSEAEAGIAEVLYQITRDENIEGDGNQENPKIEWGLNGETIRATTTPGMGADEAYHVVTFDTGSSFPYSTNNTTLTNDSGYGGRVVPDGMLHVISTGYCKGQYRTIECVIEKPPFPFGLATSGKIDSADPIRVLGTSSQSGYHSGETDRPGHILCNSPEGVVIRADENGVHTTEISGFVKSVGPVNIEQPAMVRGGVQSNAEATVLTDIDIQDFNLDTTQAEGVISLLDDDYHENQELDVMYKYLRGGTLHYHGDVDLQQAMLWVQGNLVIDGAVTGEGLIVVTGNVDINDGAALNGTDKMALLAGGNIDIGRDGGSPEANFFSGLVYTEGNLNAKNITIVGNAVVNSPDPDKGHAILENVTFISNEETGDMTVTITSTSEAVMGENTGWSRPDTPNFFTGGAGGWTDPETGVGNQGWIQPTDDDDKLRYIADNQLRGVVMSGTFGETGQPFQAQVPPGQGGPHWDAFMAMAGAVEEAQEAYEETVEEIEELENELSGLDPDDDGDRISEINNRLAELTPLLTSIPAEADEAYLEAAFNIMKAIRDENRQRTNANGTLKTTVSVLDVTREERFNLNEYLPQSDRVKMSFWKVYPRRM